MDKDGGCLTSGEPGNIARLAGMISNPTRSGRSRHERDSPTIWTDLGMLGPLTSSNSGTLEMKQSTMDLFHTAARC